MSRYDLVVVDLDGTLVDSNYHHVLAWLDAFASVGVLVSGAQVHRCLGMGGDQLVEAVAGHEVEHRVGDAVRDLWKSGYDAMVDRVRPLPGATDLVETLRDTGRTVVLATSGHPAHTDVALDVLGLHGASFPLVTSADAERTKPHPDLIEAALRHQPDRRGVAVGDTVWDVRAAAAASIDAIGLTCGGIDAETLMREGAVAVRDDPARLADSIDELF